MAQNTLRECKKCHAIKPVNQFYLRQDGKPNSKCQACVKEENRVKYSVRTGATKPCS